VLAVVTGRAVAGPSETPEQLLAWWWQFPLDTPVPKPAKLDAAQAQALWDELAGEEGPGAYRALRTLAGGRGATVAFLAQRLKPVLADAERIARRIAQLDSNKHAVREEATAELSRLGRAAEEALREARKTKASPEAATRIAQLLEACGRPYPGTPHARRGARAVRVLEVIGTQQALKILNRLARGIGGAGLTEQAKAALKRLGK
jgi:hypothetical protein